MTNENFQKELEVQLKHCREILTQRATKYTAHTDRLANFKKAASLQNVKPTTALFGMMAKHIVSLSDFIERHERSITYTKDNIIPTDSEWEEVLTDIINYCILLHTLLVETKGEQK